MSKDFPPSHYRIWEYTKTTGGLEKNLTLNSNRPLPTPNPDQHLVQIISVALNPVDYKPAEAVGRLVLPKIATPGIDIAAVIIKPAQNSPLKPGQIVFGAASDKPFAAGGLAEFATVPSSSVTELPSGIDPVEASSLPVAGLTAIQAIQPFVKEGDHILINGGSGGVGTIAIQVAKILGCRVTTTCSTRNVELVKSLGADDVYDYTQHPDLPATLKEAVSTKKFPPFNHIVDNVYTSDTLYYQCHNYTTPTCKYICVAGAPSMNYLSRSLKMKFLPGILGGGKREFSGMLTKTDQAQARQLTEWMTQDKLKAVIDQRFPFEQAVEAFERLKTHRARGKVVIEVNPEGYFRG